MGMRNKAIFGFEKWGKVFSTNQNEKVYTMRLEETVTLVDVDRAKEK